MPLACQATAVQQAVDITVAVGLGLQGIGITGLQAQVGSSVHQAGHLLLLDQRDLHRNKKPNQRFGLLVAPGSYHTYVSCKENMPTGCTPVLS